MIGHLDLWLLRKEPTMRAIAIEAYGGSERLQVMELPIPEVGPNDVLIRVRALTRPMSVSAKGAMPR